MNLKNVTGKFDKEAKYLRYRNNNIKQLFSVCDRFGFKQSTAHLAVTIYDHFLCIDKIVDRLRTNYKSCHNVVSE